MNKLKDRPIDLALEERERGREREDNIDFLLHVYTGIINQNSKWFSTRLPTE